MQWTDRHCRYFHRLLTRRALLYTEMVTAPAILFGPRERLLRFHDREHPVALQLGGAVPHELADAAALGTDAGFDEINLNVGCPSDRVQNGRFGACLMREPKLVGQCVRAMQDAVHIPVTVKCRIGVDDQDSEQDLEHFVTVLAEAGCRTIIIHARKAWLKGLSPAQNRDVPPLDYARVYRLKDAHPELEIIINGGISSLADADTHLRYVDGVMMGRAAYQTPYLLSDVDRRYFGDRQERRERAAIVRDLIPYIEMHMSEGGRLNNVTRHILGLFAGQRGARAFRRHLSEYGTGDNVPLHCLEDALAKVETAQSGFAGAEVQ